ncbi:LPS export ABC transporter periplasmic protein LptC [Niveibacterium sp. SC-1]|uniref:LPS export ABC transporter periplasmic protein LptC n=1 Tax=Niveibacterium sp. SC-1 TaxID=3135646 RepID=UPI00311DE8EE
MKRSYNLFPVVLAGVLAGTSFWLDHFIRDQGARPDGGRRHDPDMIAEGAVQERFDSTGKRQYILKTSRFEHFPDDDSTRAEHPDLAHFGRNEPLYLTAQKSQIRHGGKEVLLVGDVRGRREAGADTPAATFATEELTVLPDEERAYTDLAVHMTRGNSVLDGVGMELDQVEGTAVIDQVRATLQPKNRQARKP